MGAAVRGANVFAVAGAFGLALLAGCAGGAPSPSSAPSNGVSPSVPSASSSAASASNWAVSAAAPDTPTASAVIGEDSWGNMLESLGPDAIAFGRRVQGELPQAGYVQWSGVGGGEAVALTDPGEVRALFNALATASLAGEATEVRSDDYLSVWFVFADGGRFSVAFDSMAIDLPGDDGHTFYEIAANDDLNAFVAIAQQETRESW